MFESYGDELPEEVREYFEERNLLGEAFQHDLFEWIDSLGERELSMFKSVVYEYSDRPSAAYMVGVVNMTLDKNYGICHACGKKHQDIKVEDIVPEAAVPKEGVSRDTTIPKEVVFAQMSGPDLLANVPKSEQDVMDEYGVDFIEYEYPRVICKNCKAVYINLRDRVLREPGVDGCSGCQDKTRWG